MTRRFRFRVRSGHALFRFGDDVEDEAAGRTYQAGDELLVDEPTAATMLRMARRSVELIEIVDDRPERAKRLPG